MIHHIRIQGFKCFDEVELEFSNFTLLAGRNSAGKSTVIQAILALYQNSASSFAGPYMNLGRVEELRNRIVGSREILLEAEYGASSVYGKRISGERREERWGEPFPEEMGILYLAADRVGVQDTYEMSLDWDNEIGVRCEYAFSYLAEHGMEGLKEPDFVFDDTAKLTFGGQVDYWLDRIMGYRVMAELIQGTELVRVLYGNDRLGRRIRPKNVGTGVSYLAEIVIAALSCKKGDILMIENPGIHLHPSGQAEFVSFLAFLAQRGLQVVMETHSDHIYNGLRRCISSDWLSCEKAAVYFFSQDESRLCRPVAVKLDEKGHVMNQQDGLFDQIEKDLDIILGW